MNKYFKRLLILISVLTTGCLCVAQQVKTKKPGSVKMKVDSALTIFSGDQPLLTYQFRTIYPPNGIDTNYKRSGFIHPLYTPHGQVLTNIQPRDHYHHYGIWNPWTHTFFEGDTVDFWNIKGHQGTVRFAKFTSQKSNSKYSEYTALHEHVVFNKDGSVALPATFISGKYPGKDVIDKIQQMGKGGRIVFDQVVIKYKDGPYEKYGAINVNLD